jgi:ATP-binding cassette, subfamily B (MDR/TAP), member 10
MGVAMAAQLISAGSTMLFPLALGRIVDTVQAAGGAAADLDTIVLGLAGIFTVAGMATATRVTTLSIVGGRISRRMRKGLFDAVLRQDTAFFDKNQSGELVNRLSTDVSVVARTLTDNSAKLLRNSITGATSLCMVAYLSPKLTAVALGFVPPMFLFGVIFGRTQRRLSRDLVDALAAATQVASERIGAIRTVRLFGAEAFESARYARRVDETYGLGQRVALADGVFTGGMFYAAQMSLLGVLYVGGGMVLDPANALSVGMLTSFSMYAVNLGISASSIGSAYGQLLRALGSGQRVFQVIDRKPHSATSTLPLDVTPDKYLGMPNTPSPAMSDNSAGADSMTTSNASAAETSRYLRLEPGFDATVEFRNVHFGFDDKHEILRGVDLTVRPGEICAVAGASGSGKSTLLGLLSRLYLPTSGTIHLGGANVSELDVAWLRTNVAAVPQDPMLFNGTIASNILYAMPQSTTMREVEEAARAAASHDMIMSLPGGYETVVGERGQGLSGGQRARVAIARALMRRPRVLVLDEATAALDNESEVAVAAAISSAAAFRNVTVLLIAHRVSSLRRAHRVAVLADGRILESGTFEELVAKRNDSYLGRMVAAGDSSGRSVTSSADDGTSPIRPSSYLDGHHVARERSI